MSIDEYEPQHTYQRGSTDEYVFCCNDFAEMEGTIEGVFGAAAATENGLLIEDDVECC